MTALINLNVQHVKVIDRCEGCCGKIKETSNTNWMTMILEASRWQSSQQFSPSTCSPLNEGAADHRLDLDPFRGSNDTVMADTLDSKQTVYMQSHNAELYQMQQQYMIKS